MIDLYAVGGALRRKIAGLLAAENQQTALGHGWLYEVEEAARLAVNGAVRRVERMGLFGVLGKRVDAERDAVVEPAESHADGGGRIPEPRPPEARPGRDARHAGEALIVGPDSQIDAQPRQNLPVIL